MFVLAIPHHQKNQLPVGKFTTYLRCDARISSYSSLSETTAFVKLTLNPIYRYRDVFAMCPFMVGIARATRSV
jgi:hypothetical protein